jgi:hypothetical protein
MNKTQRHEHGKGDKMQASQRFWQSFIITGKTAETCSPGKRAFHDPTLGQKNKAALGFGQLDDDQVDAIFSSSLGGIITRVALVNKGYLHRLARHLLNLRAELGDLCPFLLVGGCDQKRQQGAQCVYRQMHLATALAFVSVPTRTTATLQGQIRRHQRPFFVTDITWVCFSFHPSSILRLLSA